MNRTEQNVKASLTIDGSFSAPIPGLVIPFFYIGEQYLCRAYGVHSQLTLVARDVKGELIAYSCALPRVSRSSSGGQVRISPKQRIECDSLPKFRISQ